MSVLAECPHCLRPVAGEDRYCRHCGGPLQGAPDGAGSLPRTLLESIPIGVFTLDAAARVRYWNGAMEKQSGQKRRVALGRVLFEVLPHLQPFTHRITRAFDTALPLRLDPITHEAGATGALTESFWFQALLLEDGSPALLGVMEDITQKVRVDTQLIRSERLAAVGELAAGIAHNFNNILAAIGGDAQLLKLLAEEERLPAHVAEAAQQIHEETMRGGRIAHDLLSFARGAEPRIQRLDVREVVLDTGRLIKNHPAARTVTIEVDIRPDLPHTEADANLLHQVFFNVMLNALQAMPGGGLLTVSAGLRPHDRDPDAGVLDLKFHDTGVGIPRDHLRRIFDPFFSKRADGGSGSGLGLPVSLSMVKSIGGDIQIASAEGIGTTVTVSLPIVERRATGRHGCRLPAGARALIVDDDAEVRRTLTSLLTRRGFDVVTAADGEEAAARFEEAPADRPFDVVLAEVILARGDGMGMIRRMHALCPEVPLIVLTGATDPNRLSEALECGAQFSFSKPPNFRELLTVIEELLRSRAAEEVPEESAGERLEAPAWQKGCQSGN